MTMARRGTKRLCGAKKRQGPGYCTQVAGWGTDHVGQGRCKLHGGCSRIKTGRWSGVRRDSIRDRLEALRKADQEPLELEADLNLIRALTLEYLDRCGGSQAKRSGARRNRQALDVFAAVRLIETGSRVAERIHRIRKSGAISIAAFRRIQEQMAQTVAKHVEDEDALRAIEKDWSEIRL